jgi:hypothetical protein
LRASDRDDTTLDLQTRVELSVIGTDEPRLRAIFDGLADGGTVRVSLAKQFWGDTFGAITDKYGIGWQVNIGLGRCERARPATVPSSSEHRPCWGVHPPVSAAAHTLPAGQW